MAGARATRGRPTRHNGRVKKRALIRAAALAALAVIVIAACGSAAGAPPATTSAAVTIGAATAARPVPAGFVGLSMEYRGLAAYAGQNPAAVDPVFEQLLRDISPDQSPVLRIGGDSSDWTWWPVAHMAQPPGVKYSLTPAYLSVLRALSTALRARLILGLNLEAGSPRVAAAEADAFTSRIGAASLDALELGNEPELYASFGWYKSKSGAQVPGRAPGFDPADLIGDYTSFSHALPAVALAGPSSGAPVWLAQLGAFLQAEPRVRLATVHAYPLKHCTKSELVTISQLLSDTSSQGLAATVAPYLAAATAHGVPMRIDEMNGVSCGGFRGVSNTFASALWVLDTLFEMAKLGVSGVNIHTVPDTINEILGPSITNGQWQMKVHPEFYGMMMFAQAAPPGSRLLALSSTPPAGVKVWATSGTDGHIRVVVINKLLSGPAVVALRIPAASGSASVEQLLAPSVSATGGITLGGQTFGAETSTGELAGASALTTLAPAAGSYVVTVPAASATLLTLSSG